MIIQKFGHSCLRIENAGRVLLIDPGAFCFIERSVTPLALLPANAILITHTHGDHVSVDAVRSLGVPVYGPEDVRPLLEPHRIPFTAVTGGLSLEIGGFHVDVLDAPHAASIDPQPTNVAYCINGRVLHLGDALDLEYTGSIDVLALPYAGPFVTLAEAVVCARRIHPAQVLPIHDAQYRDFFRTRQEQRLAAALESDGIRVTPLKYGDRLEV